jgi:8-oxo-dGTP pyrophosphatase MutT (NUDIX family)
MHPVYALENLPDPCLASLFLAGPTPRDPVTPSWRPGALRLLAELGYTGAVIIPEARDGEWRHSYTDQIGWEVAMRARADLIVFWVPRELPAMPAFTTNVEFGEDYGNCRSLYGRPAEAQKCRYFDERWEAMTGRAPHESLRALLAEAVALIGEGAVRHGAERDVPLAVWRSEPFAEWHRAQAAAGHVLRQFQVRHVLPRGPSHPTSPLFGFLAWAAVAVAGEERVKANEVFLARPDTVAVVPVYNSGVDELFAEAFLAREYRLAVRNPSGFAVEPPGGSSPVAGLPLRAIAIEELAEELGLRRVDPARLIDLGSRQCAASLCSHHTHVFALPLFATEARKLRKFAEEGRVFGADGEERIQVVRQPLAGRCDASLDWAGIGMLVQAARALAPRKKRN